MSAKKNSWHLAFHPHACSSKLMQTRNSHDFSVVQFDILLSEDITKGQLHDGMWGSSTTHNSKVFPMLVSDSLTAGARVAARDFFVSYWNSAAASTRSVCAMQRKLSLHTTIRKRSFHLSKSTWPRETNPVILAFDTAGIQCCCQKPKKWMHRMLLKGFWTNINRKCWWRCSSKTALLQWFFFGGSAP